MRPELRIVQGGRSPRTVRTDNIVYLTDSRHGIEPPSALEVCAALFPRLPDGVGGLVAAAVSVFLEMSGERWLRSEVEVGLDVSLVGAPVLSKNGPRGKVTATLKPPHWTMSIREGTGGHYHLLLPPRVRQRPTVVTFLWDGGEGRPTQAHRLTFHPSEDGWKVVAHDTFRVLVEIDETGATCLEAGV